MKFFVAILTIFIASYHHIACAEDNYEEYLRYEDQFNKTAFLSDTCAMSLAHEDPYLCEAVFFDVDGRKTRRENHDNIKLDIYRDGFNFLQLKFLVESDSEQDVSWERYVTENINSDENIAFLSSRYKRMSIEIRKAVNEQYAFVMRWQSKTKNDLLLGAGFFSCFR